MIVLIKERMNSEFTMNKIPVSLHYSHLLTIAENKFKISRDEARNRYGLFTYKKWNELLNK